MSLYHQEHFANPVSPVETVPGTLRGFRWMKLFRGVGSNPPRLSSLVLMHRWQPEENVASCPIRPITFVDIESWNGVECRSCAKQLLGTTLTVHNPSRLFRYTVVCKHRTNASALFLSDPFGPVRRSPYGSIDFEVTYRTEFEATTHTPPARRCQCGFYASYDVIPLKETPGAPMFGPSSTTSCVLAVVQSYGKIILGEIGFRAEKMKIEALFPSIIDFPTLQLMEWADSGVNLHAGDGSPNQLYPPDDLSALLPPKEPDIRRVMLDKWITAAVANEKSDDDAG